MPKRLSAFFFTIGFFLFFPGIYLLAQQSKADSLKRMMTLADDTTRIRLKIELSEAFLDFSSKKALEPASEARMLASQIGNEPLEARALFAMGNVNYKTGNFKDAISCFEKAGTLFQQLGDEKSYAETLIAASNTFKDKGDYSYSLDRSLSAYRISEKLNDKKGMARALITSGEVYRKTKKPDKAIDDYEKAMSFCKEVNDASGEASCLNNLAIVFSGQDDNDKAIEYYMKAKSIYEKTGDKYSMAKVLNNIGTIYYSNEQLDFAADYFLQALEIRKQIGDKRGQATALTNLGSVSYDQNNPDKAIDYFNRAIELAKNIGAVDVQSTIYEYLSEAYSKKGEYEKALEFFRMSASLKDSLFDKDFTDKIAEMQAQYGVEKAESDARAQEEQKKLITWSAVIGGVLLFIILLILWNRAVTRKRVNIRLNQQKEEIEQKNTDLHEANEEIERKNKDITDSILYASRIQGAILPEVEFQATFGEKGFVLYRPKDIVSGDFYWMEQTLEQILFAAVDCTGHGVPGAFVSIVCSNLLSQAVNEHGLTLPKEILDDVNIRLSETLRQRQDESRVRDGMDIALCCLDRRTLMLQYAGAFNPVWIFRGSEFFELLPDKFPVGHYVDEELKKFTAKEFQLQTGDRVYVFSDGYSDQFGGPNGKKFKRSSFVELLRGIQTQPFERHRYLLEEAHLRWKGDYEQIDDVLVLGIEIG